MKAPHALNSKIMPVITDAISCWIPDAELIYVLPFPITVIKNEEKITPIGLLFPSNDTAIASNPVLANTFG